MSGYCNRWKIKDDQLNNHNTGGVSSSGTPPDRVRWQKIVVVRSGKGEKDRETVLPGSIIPTLEDHLKSIKTLYKKDRESNQPGVALPGALEKKWPNAGKEWAWFWVFPSERLSTDPRSSVIRRHHAHKSVLHKHIKKAALKAKICKPEK